MAKKRILRSILFLCVGIALFWWVFRDTDLVNLPLGAIAFGILAIQGKNNTSITPGEQPGEDEKNT